VNAGRRPPGEGFWVRDDRTRGPGVITERAYAESGSADAVETDQAREAMRAHDRVLLLTVLAAAFLFLAFGLNWEINRDAFHVVEMSSVLEALGPVESSVVALAVASIIVALPPARKKIPFELTPWRTAAIIGGILLLIYYVSGGPMEFLVVVVQTFVLVFYSAPLIFGLYGIFYHRPVHLVISAMFSLFTMGGLPRPEASEWPVVLTCVVLFLLFVEVAESSIRCWNMLDSRRLSDAHLASFIDHYLRHMALFMSLGVLLTILIIQLPLVVGAMGLKALAASIELASPYGQMTAAVVVLGSLAVIRFLLDRGFLAPWIRRGRALAARLRDMFWGTRTPREG